MPRGSFSSNFCPKLTGFFRTRASQQLIKCCQSPLTIVNWLVLMNLLEVFTNSWTFYQEALPKSCFISRVDSLLDNPWKLAATFEKLNQQIHFNLHCKGWLFLWGAYFCMGCDVVVVIKIAAYIHGAYFLWVLIVQILWKYLGTTSLGIKLLFTKRLGKWC